MSRKDVLQRRTNILKKKLWLSFDKKAKLDLRLTKFIFNEHFLLGVCYSFNSLANKSNPETLWAISAASFYGLTLEINIECKTGQKQFIYRQVR